MKTLIFFAALILVSGFAFNNANSQNPVKEVFTGYYIIPFTCLNQNLAGSLNVERISMNNHLQIRHYGTLTGESDGLEYYAEMMTNIADKANWDELGQEAITQTWPANYHISRDGKLIGIVHFAYHYTVNANGEWTSYHGDAFEYNCVSEGRIK